MHFFNDTHARVTIHQDGHSAQSLREFRHDLRQQETRCLLDFFVVNLLVVRVEAREGVTVQGGLVSSHQLRAQHEVVNATVTALQSTAKVNILLGFSTRITYGLSGASGG